MPWQAPRGMIPRILSGVEGSLGAEGARVPVAIRLHVTRIPTRSRFRIRGSHFAVHNFLVCVPAYSYRLGTHGGRPPWLPKEFQWLIFPASSST